MTELRTRRLLLREFDRSDFGAVHEYASDPEVVRYTIFGPNTPEETLAFIERSVEERRHDPRRAFHMAVTRRDTGSLLGSCSVSLHEPEDRVAELGYVLRRDAWGQGFATEAAARMVRFGFERLGLHRIFARCDTCNTASARVMQKLHMRREGHLRQALLRKGQWRDSYLYAILEEEWRAPAASGA